ncbi:hypothetical protein B0I37DRAFT_56611 [Chaetomium sp. MPI-CAGE-AT-0009]|nr:hypothetical protein B0I37DRAFT_56611 [Chaetomium sp. MPI-CAGE-AT-0009]
MLRLPTKWNIIVAGDAAREPYVDTPLEFVENPVWDGWRCRAFAPPLRRMSYILARRVVILVEIFVSLREMPEDVYSDIERCILITKRYTI